MIIRYLGLGILAVGSYAVIVSSGIWGCAPAPTSQSALVFPETCQEVQDQAVEETGERPANGTYTLYVDGDENKPWDAYCHDMNRAEPIEYLTVSETNNYSQIRNDTSVAQTTYRRLRIDPVRLEIDPLDDTFATNDFESFTPVFPVDTMESIPAGWAEVQPLSFNMSPAAEAQVDLTDTPFVFSEDILLENIFFCQVDSAGVNSAYTTGTGAEVAADLTSFHLMAVNTNSEDNSSGISTREVADCADLGTGATDFSSGAIPLQYSQ